MGIMMTHAALGIGPKEENEFVGRGAGGLFLIQTLQEALAHLVLCD